MNVFFDTEFTGLQQNTNLISIGMIDENGRMFYGEFTDYDSDKITPWIEKNVLTNLFNGDWDHFEKHFPFVQDQKNLTVSSGSSDFIKKDIEKWLLESKGSGINRPIQLISDCYHYDMVLFCELFGGALLLPSYISSVCVDINQMMADYLKCTDRAAFNYRRENFVTDHNPNFVIPDGLKHNSLWDAYVIKEIYKILEPMRFRGSK